MSRLHHHCLALATAIALGGAALPSMAIDGIQTYTSGAPFYKRVVTNTNVETTESTTFANVPGATTTIFVPGQTTVLISVDYAAEARCYIPSGAADAGSWCEVQVLIGGVEGSPQASSFGGDTYSFAATDSGNATAASWRGHALSRHRCIRNTSNAALQVPIALQWKTVQFGNDPVNFWLDDSALVVQMSRDCQLVNSPAGFSRAADSQPSEGQR